jgi:hypothetical protein
VAYLVVVSEAGGHVRAATARTVNERIREIAGELEARLPVSAPYEFLCSCGCFGRLRATVDEYDELSGDLLLPGHSLQPHEEG